MKPELVELSVDLQKRSYALLRWVAECEAAALAAYGQELERRMKDAGTGPAGLALWRAFAWTRQGSPKHGFELTAQQILDAEARLAQSCSQIAEGRSTDA